MNSFEKVENIYEGLIILDNNTSLVWANKKSYELFQLQLHSSPDEISALRDRIEQSDLLHFIKLNQFHIGISQKTDFQSKDCNGVISYFEATILKKDSLYYIHFIDINIRKNFESKFLQVQRLHSLGPMISGLTHDFNNKLTVIKLNLDSLKMDKGLSQKHLNTLKNAELSISQASELSKKILLYGKGSQEGPLVVDLNNLIHQNIKNLRRLCGDQIQFEFIPSPKGLYSYIDPIEVDQILLNLTVNAKDAMPDGGRILIETKIRSFTAPTPFSSEVIAPGNYCNLIFSDTGVGMDQETLSKIFTPYFSTKPTDKGTGLGLSTVFSIVKKANGCINVHSRKSEGSTFNLFFPLRTSVNKEVEAETEITSLIVNKKWKILLVEDNQLLSDSLKENLIGLNQTVTVANSAEEAIAISTHLDFDLLISDITMPGLSGDILAKFLRETHPHIKIVLISGSPNSFSQRESPYPLLSKPFSTQDLIKKINNL